VSGAKSIQAWTATALEGIEGRFPSTLWVPRTSGPSSRVSVVTTSWAVTCDRGGAAPGWSTHVLVEGTFFVAKDVRPVRIPGLRGVEEPRETGFGAWGRLRGADEIRAAERDQIFFLRGLPRECEGQQPHGDVLLARLCEQDRACEWIHPEVEIVDDLAVDREVLALDSGGEPDDLGDLPSRRRAARCEQAGDVGGRADRENRDRLLAAPKAFTHLGDARVLIRGGEGALGPQQRDRCGDRWILACVVARIIDPRRVFVQHLPGRPLCARDDGNASFALQVSGDPARHEHLGLERRVSEGGAEDSAPGPRLASSQRARAELGRTEGFGTQCFTQSPARPLPRGPKNRGSRSALVRDGSPRQAATAACK